MTLRRTLLLAAIIAVLPATPSAAVSQDVALFTGDSRLQQQVTYTARGITVAEVLAELTQSTGVVMGAGQDENDWTTRDRKLVVHVKDMKLADLMHEIAAILRFNWTRGGEAPKWTYRLSQDKQQRDEQQSLRSATEDASTRQLREKRESALSDLVNLGSLSAADAESLKTADPWRYVLATEPLGSDVARFFGAFPDARNAFIQGFEVGFPVSQLSPDLQAVVRRIAESYDSLTHSIGASEDHSDLLAKFAKLQITINRDFTGRADDVLSKSLLGRISIGIGSEFIDVPLFDPSSAMGKALGAAIVRLQSGASKEEVAKQLQAAIAQAVRSTSVKHETSRDISSDPALKRSVRLFEVDAVASLPMALESLALNSRMNVISDYFPSVDAPIIPAGQKPLGEQLEIIADTYGSNWEKAGDTLRFRDKQWFGKRAWEVPEAWITYWIERGKVNKGFLLEDLVQIGNLRDDQIDHTIMANRQLIGYGAGDAARNRQILRFYALLTEDQRKSVFDGQLQANSLDDAQWEALRKALATKGAAYAAVQKGSQVIKLTQTATSPAEYTFAYHPGNGEPAVLFKVSAVIYEYKPAPPGS